MGKNAVAMIFFIFSSSVHAQVDMTTALDNAYCVGVSQVGIEMNKGLMSLSSVPPTAKRSAEMQIQKIEAEIERRMIFLKAYLSSVPSHKDAIISMIEQGDKDQRMCLGMFADNCSSSNSNEVISCGNKTFKDFCPVKTKNC